MRRPDRPRTNPVLAFIMLIIGLALGALVGRMVMLVLINLTVPQLIFTSVAIGFPIGILLALRAVPRR